MDCCSNLKGHELSSLEVDEEWKLKGGLHEHYFGLNNERSERGFELWEERVGVRGSRQCEVKRKYLWFLNEFKNSPSALFALRTGRVLKEVVHPRNTSL